MDQSPPMKTMYIIIILVIVAAIVAVFFFKPFEKLIVERNNEPLSSGYAKFREVDENYHSNGFEVKLLCNLPVSSSASPNPIRIFLSVNDQLIVDMDARVDEDTKADTRYFKLDKTGKVIDTLYDAYKGYWGQFINEFMVFTSEKDDYYTTWPLNGDTTKHNMTVLNDNNWTDQKIDEQIKTTISESKYYFFYAYVDKGSYYRKFYFFKDQKWQVVLQKMPEYTTVPDEQSASRYKTEVFRSGEFSFDQPTNVKLLHFYPEEKMKYYHVIGGGAGGFSVYNWRGKAFFRTVVGGKNFDFMVPKLVLEKEKHNGYKPYLYRVEEPGASSKFYIPAFYISANGFAFYSPKGQELYLIRQKNKS